MAVSWIGQQKQLKRKHTKHAHMQANITTGMNCVNLCNHLSKQSKQESLFQNLRMFFLDLCKQKARPVATKNSVFQLPAIQFKLRNCTQTMSIYTHTIYLQYKMHMFSAIDFLCRSLIDRGEHII